MEQGRTAKKRRTWSDLLYKFLSKKLYKKVVQNCLRKPLLLLELSGRYRTRTCDLFRVKEAR